MHVASKKISSSLLLSIAFTALSIAPVHSDDLASIKERAFSSGNACYLDTNCGKNPYYSVHRNNGQNTTIKLAPNLAHPKALQYTLRDLGTCGKVDHVYIGGHKTIIGDEIHDSLIKLGLCPKRTYQHTLFTHEYLQNMPMKLSLRSVEDLRSFASHLKSTLADKTYKYADKPILFLEIAQDPALSTLDDDDKAFIAEYFTLCDHTNYFNECWKDLMSQNCDLEGARPKYRSENVAETLLRQTEKACNYFIGHDVTVGITWKITSLIASIIAYEKIVKPIAHNTAGSICNCCSAINVFKR